MDLIVDEGDGDQVIRGAVRCSTCSNLYPIDNGIALLRHPWLSAVVHDEQALSRDIREKRRQIAHFDGMGISELEVTRPHSAGRVYGFLLETKINTALALYGRPLSGRRIVDVCCGSGMDAEFLCRAGADVTAVDISLGAVRGAQERARRYRLKYDLIVADTEDLPFSDRAFDLSFVHDGLHHLSSPHAGFAEMARVASEAVLLTEPAKAFATTIAIHLGLAQAVEESGNWVHRFTEAELERLSLQAGLAGTRLRRYAMYYRQEPLRIFRWFESPLSFAVFVSFYRMANKMLGRWGNKIAAVAFRETVNP